MKHIDVYLLLTHHTQILDMPTSAQNEIITAQLDIPWSKVRTEQFLASLKPKTWHVVKALTELGFTRNYISTYLGITRQSVANALQRPHEEYVNPFLFSMLYQAQQEN